MKIIHILHPSDFPKLMGHIPKNRLRLKIKCVCIYEIIQLIVMKMKMKMKKDHVDIT